jgi:hypothetical protein
MRTHNGQAYDNKRAERKFYDITGYAGKVEYWASKVTEGAKELDYKLLFEAKLKLDYFINKHKEFIHSKIKQ